MILAVRAPNGRKPTNHRFVLDGIFWIAWTGAPCAGLIPTAGGRVAQRTLERAAQACEQAAPGPGGQIIAIAPLIAARGKATAPGDPAMSRSVSRAGSLAASLAERLARNGTRNVLILHEDASGTPVSDGAETRSLAALQAAVRQTTPSHGSDLDALAMDLRSRYDYTLFVMAPLTTALRSDPHRWAYDITLLTLAWGSVLPGFVRDALDDHPTFRQRLATIVLDGAHLPTARRYMSLGSYEERETHS